MNAETEAPEENLFVLVAMLARKLGKTPLNNRLFIHRLDEHWTVVVNGCSTERGFKEYRIPPGYCFVEFAAFPAALFSPYGGFFEGVEGAPMATEAEFVRVIKEVTLRATVNPEEEHA
jgi:hypothetical protein